MTEPRYASVILDVDSTLSGIEGIDWLAARRGPELGDEVKRLTDRAMSGEIALDDVYGQRLDLVRPSRSDIDALSSAYIEAIAPGANVAVSEMLSRGVLVVVVSGGLRAAILPLAESLGVAPDRVYAVDVTFDRGGKYEGFERSSPLATQRGKPEIVSRLALPRSSLMVGDGATDAAVKPVVDAFAAFTGFVHRTDVVAGADFVFHSFDDISNAVLR